MEPAALLDRLAADHARLTEVAARDLTGRVPSCPEWTVGDLVRHVAMVYLHKVACMRLGHEPADWPPDLSAEEPLALLDRAYAQLTAEFAARRPTDASYTWYPPDQTVGFWIRRMAQETAMHRVDAELAAGDVTPIAADLAVDGVDEALVTFLAYFSRSYPDGFDLAAGPAVAVAADGQLWEVQPTPEGVHVDPAAAGEGTVATVSGRPSDVLLWLWRRAPMDAVEIEGDPAAAERLYALMGAATQ